MQKSKTYDIMNLTGTADSKDKTKQFSGLGLNNTNSSYTFDPLGDVNKNLFKTKTDDYKDTEYKEEHKTSNAETKLLQETLNKNGYKGSDNKPLVVDGIYGPNTEYAYNNAVKNNWKNLNQTQLDIERDVISSAVNKTYSSLMEKADNRKLNMSQEDVKTLQKILNDGGYTDLQGNTLAIDGILGDKTKYAFEKYIQGDIPKAEVFELQKILNKYDIKDRNQKALAVDGKLGPKTDSAVYNAIAKYGKTADKKKDNKTLDKISDFLTWASLIPGLDTLSNLAAIPVDLLRGDYISAGLSAAGMIPYFGEAADAAKLAKMAGKTAKVLKSADTIIDTAKAANKTDDVLKVTSKIVDAVNATDDVGDTLKLINKGTDAGKVADNTSDVIEYTNKVIDTTNVTDKATTAASKSVKTVDYTSQVYNARSMPERGDANSLVQNYRKGRLSTERYFDENGSPYLDIDYSDHGNPKMHPIVPHEHNIEIVNGHLKREKKGRAISK